MSPHPLSLSPFSYIYPYIHLSRFCLSLSLFTHRRMTMLALRVAQPSILSCLYFACGGERSSSIWINIWIISQARPQGVLLLGGLFSDRLVNAPLFSSSFVRLRKKNRMSGIDFSFNTLFMFLKMFFQRKARERSKGLSWFMQ